MQIKYVYDLAPKAREKKYSVLINLNKQTIVVA